MGPPESSTQTVSRLVQPFCTDHAVSLYLQRAAHSPPSKLPRPIRGSGPHLIHGRWVHPSLQPKRHLDGLSRFCRVQYCDRQTDRPRYSVDNSRSHLVRSTALRPNNDMNCNSHHVKRYFSEEHCCHVLPPPRGIYVIVVVNCLSVCSC